MTKKIPFGKIAYTSKRKINLVELSIELKSVDNKFKIDYETLQLIPSDSFCLSICGSIWDSEKKDWESGGQNLDEIAKYLKDPNFKTIYKIWKEYHLNDMQAGTKKQTAAVNLWINEGNKYEYDLVCEYLKSINLYIDRGYKYGSNWLYKSIPVEIVNYIKNIN
jgi:hypothetical protein